VIDVEFDLKTERFDVRFDAARTSKGEILAVVRGQGYEPRIVQRVAASTATSESIDVSQLPEELQRDFEAAARSGRDVLFDFTAPG
jgi:hypothetical protein